MTDEQIAESETTMRLWCPECQRRTYTRVIYETRPDSKYWSEDPTKRKRPVRHCRQCGRSWDFDSGDQIAAHGAWRDLKIAASLILSPVNKQRQGAANTI